jgi:hypothetical protein
LKKASSIELSIRRLAALSAACLLTLRAYAKKHHDDAGPTIIRIIGGMPPN